MKTPSFKRLSVCLVALLCVSALFFTANATATALTGSAAGGAEYGLSVGIEQSAGKILVCWNSESDRLYTVSVNGTIVGGPLSHNSFDITPFVASGGSYTVVVTADNGTCGETVYEHTVVLSAPNNLTFSDGIIRWDSDYTDDVVFRVCINGIAVGETAESFFDITDFVLNGDYTVSVAAHPADKSDYVIHSSPSEYSFSVSLPPLPPATVKPVFSRDKAYVVWSGSADGAEGYVVTLSTSDGVVLSETVTTNCLDITAYISRNTEFTFSICTVKDGLCGFTRTITIPPVGEETP